MPRFQFIHAADLHLGAPFAGLHQSNSRIAQLADQATYTAFDKIIDCALREKVLFVLFAGDIYDADEPNLKAQLHFRDGIKNLDKAGIQSVVVRGNHDHCGSERVAWEPPSTYHEFASGANEPHHISQNGEIVAAIYGYSYPQRAVTENIVHHYELQLGDEKYFCVGMLHGNVGGNSEHDNYAPCSVADLTNIGMNYWALGHVHTQKVLSEQPFVAYPGTPQGLSPRETGTHGSYLVSVDGNDCAAEFVPMDSLRWLYVSHNVGNAENIDDLLEQIETQLNGLEQTEQCMLFVRLDLEGRSQLHRDLQDVETLRSQLNARLENVWIDRLRNQTRPDVDIEQKRQQKDFLGDYLRLSESVPNDEDLREKVLLELDEVLNHAVVKDALGIGVQADREAWITERFSKWLQDAEVKGVDLLMEDER